MLEYDVPEAMVPPRVPASAMKRQDLRIIVFLGVGEKTGRVTSGLVRRTEKIENGSVVQHMHLHGGNSEAEGFKIV